VVGGRERERTNGGKELEGGGGRSLGGMRQRNNRPRYEQKSPIVIQNNQDKKDKESTGKNGAKKEGARKKTIAVI